MRGLKNISTFQPSGNIGAAIGFSFQGFADPATGITITGVFGGAGAYRTGSNSGAVTNGYGFYVDSPTIGSVKPTNSWGLYVENQGASGITNAAGLKILNQSGATNNYLLWLISGTNQNLVYSASADMATTGPSFSVVNDAFDNFAPLNFRASEYNFRDAVARTSESGTQKNRFRHLNSMAAVIQSGAQTITTTTLTELNFGSEIFDTDTLHDNTTNNMRITAKIAGKYLAIAGVKGELIASAHNFFLETYATNAAGSSAANAGSQIARARFSATQLGDREVTVSRIMQLDAGEFIRVNFYQDSGSDMDTDGTNTFACLAYLGE
jgi:hypothetical protein